MTKENSAFQKALEKKFGKRLAKEMVQLSKCPIHRIDLVECPRCGEAICKECL